MKRLAAGFMLFGSLLTFSLAAPPQLINYQGRLINGTNLVNGQVGLTLRIYTNATTGAYLFEDSNTVTVVDGLYSTLLGANPKSGTLTNALASGSAWVQVMINGVALSPREQIAAAAYALDGNFVKKTGDTMTGNLSINGATLSLSTTVDRGDGPRSMAIIGGGQDIEIGSGANGYWYGAAVGNGANGYSGGAAVGPSADANMDGVAVGDGAVGPDYGVAVGATSDGSDGGVAVGETAIGRNHGVAIGSNADGSQTNIAIGYMASAAEGKERIAIGHSVLNLIDNSAVIRGTLFLDGGSNVYYRETFNSGTWKALALATSAPVYVEIDPVWSAASAGIQSQINAKANSNLVWSTFAKATDVTNFVRKTGDTMTGVLCINAGAGNDLTITNTGSDVQIGNAADGDNLGTAAGYLANGTNWGVAVGMNAKGYNTGTAVGKDANGYNTGAALGNSASAFDFGVAAGNLANGSHYGVAIGSQAKGDTNGVAVGFDARGSTNGVAIGFGANGVNSGVAVGYTSYGYDDGVAVGFFANGITNGVAAGYQADGCRDGVAVGYQAKGYRAGVAVGRLAEGTNTGVAVGYFAKGSDEGVAVGYGANGFFGGTAVGPEANGANGGIAIGWQANAHSGSERIAIGNSVYNDIDNSARIRGDLYLDGGSRIYTNSSFGSSSWGVKAFTIDHPLDPQNKVLRHFCVEGPAVQNMYNGSVTLDGKGEAMVMLPPYFEKLNANAQYVLTAVGAAMPNLHVMQKIHENRFWIAGGAPAGEVSWMIISQRNDPACVEDLKNRPVEQLKGELKPGQVAAENAAVNADASTK